MRNKVLVGAGVKCLINGVNIGVVTGIQYSIQTPREEDRGIDSLAPYELSPTSVSVTGALSIIKVRDDGGLEGWNIVKPLPNISEDEYFTLELKDRMSGSTYIKVDHAAVDSQGWSVSARGVVTGQFSFHGLTAKSNFNG
jgi:hypothetical protein